MRAKTGGATVHVSVSLPEPLRDRLKVMAEAEQRSLSQQVCYLLYQALATIKENT